MYECCFPSRQVSRRVLQCEASFTSAGRVSAETWISVCVWIVIHWNADVPTILRERGDRFFFYMADRLEPLISTSRAVMTPPSSGWTRWSSRLLRVFAAMSATTSSA